MGLYGSETGSRGYVIPSTDAPGHRGLLIHRSIPVVHMILEDIDVQQDHIHPLGSITILESVSLQYIQAGLYCIAPDSHTARRLLCAWRFRVLTAAAPSSSGRHGSCHRRPQGPRIDGIKSEGLIYYRRHLRWDFLNCMIAYPWGTTPTSRTLAVFICLRASRMRRSGITRMFRVPCQVSLASCLHRVRSAMQGVRQGLPSLTMPCHFD